MYLFNSGLLLFIIYYSLFLILFQFYYLLDVQQRQQLQDAGVHIDVLIIASFNVYYINNFFAISTLILFLLLVH